MIIKCLVKPGSKKNTIKALGQHRYQVTLKAKPKNNQANKLLTQIVSEYFKFPQSSCRIIAKFHVRTKTIETIQLNTTDSAPNTL